MHKLISILKTISRWTYVSIDNRLFDPISGSLILTSLLISAGTAAASAGIEYLVAKNKKVAPVDRGKLDDIRISVPGYGEAIVKAWGTFRTAPVWFWHTPIVHTTITTPGQSGGKGSPRPPTPTTVDHVYTTSLAGVFHDGPISSVVRIWFDNDLVYNTSTDLSATKYEAESATLAGGANSTASSACSGGFRVQGIGSGGTCTFSVTVSSTDDYELGIYYTSTTDKTFTVSVNGGGTVDVNCLASGGANVVAIETLTVALNSGSNTIQFANAGAAAPDLDKIEVAPALVFDPTDPVDRRSWTGLVDTGIVPPTNQDTSWPFYNARPVVTTNTLTANLGKYGQPSIRIYLGTETQTADSAIITDKGAANAPAYRGYAYLVIEGLQLQNGRIPNVTIEVNQGTTNVATILGEIYDLVGVTSANRDFTALSGSTITGVMISSRRSAAEVVNELQTRFQFDLPEVDGKVKAVLRNGSSDLTIPYAELRAHYDGEEMPAFDAVITDIDPLLLPARVDVNYLDPVMDYHNNTQSDMRLVGPQYDNQTVSLSLVDSATNIKKLASTLLYKPDREGRSFKFTTGPKYMRAHQGTVATLTLPNATHVGRIIEARYGLPGGVCEFEAVRQQASLYTPTGTGSVSTGIESPIVPVPGNTKGIFIDSPILDPDDNGETVLPQVYIGMSGRGAGTWPGGFLYREYPHGSANYELVTWSDKPAAIGLTSTQLAAVDDVSVIDAISTVVVNFYSNVVLSSVTEAEMLANPKLNLMAITTSAGVEIVQFQTVSAGTADAPFITKYTLSNFRRGLFDSDDQVGLHTTADQAVLMNSAVKVAPISTNDINVSRNYKFVTSGQAVDDAEVTTFTWIGQGLRPRKVTDVGQARDGNNDWTIDFTGHPRPVELPASYVVEVWTDHDRSDPFKLKRQLPVTSGTAQAAMLVVVTPTDIEGGKTQGGTTITAHTGKNNLIASGVGQSAGTLQILRNQYMRIDCTVQGQDASPNLAIDHYFALYEDGTTAAIGSNETKQPCSLKFVDGGGDVDLQIRNYTTTITTVTYTYAELQAGLRFSILLSGTEYRIYKDYALGKPPLARFAAPSAGFPFPLRGLFENVTDVDFKSIMIYSGEQLSTTYSNAEQVADFGVVQSQLYLRIYQKARYEGIGNPVDI